MSSEFRLSGQPRLEAVDGLRAVAILWVAIYHYAVFWTPAGRGDPLVPYGDALAWIPLAGVGHLGVFLFFIVSGFVISFSLSRAATARQFGLLRAVRLWPTIAICGTLTFIATSAFGPASLERSVPEYLISLTFVPPSHVGKVVGEPQWLWLDGAYWSLWTEVRFYAIAALFFFMARRHFLLTWAVFAVACMAIHLAGLAQGGVPAVASRLLFAEHQPYFSAGIALAALRSDQRGPLVYVLLVMAVVQAFAYASLDPGLTVAADPDLLLGLVIVFALAALGMLARHPLPVLSSAPAVKIGQASYAYYLLHQNFGLALLAVTVPVGASYGIAAAVLLQLGILGLSLVLTQSVEAPLRRQLRALVLPRRAATG